MGPAAPACELELLAPPAGAADDGGGDDDDDDDDDAPEVAVLLDVIVAIEPDDEDAPLPVLAPLDPDPDLVVLAVAADPVLDSDPVPLTSCLIPPAAPANCPNPEYVCR